MLSFLKRKGQSTLEYAVIVAVIVGGLLAMQAYIKKGWHGRLRESADDLGEQFDPNKTTSNKTIITISDSASTTTGGNWSSTLTTGNQSQWSEVLEKVGK